MRPSKASLYAMLSAVLLSLSGGGLIWWQQKQISTDIAYVGTRIYEIKSPADGLIAQSALSDFTKVPSNTPLFRLTPAEHHDLNMQQHALEAEKSELSVMQLQAEIAIAELQIEKFEGQLSAVKGAVDTALSEHERIRLLYQRGVVDLTAAEKAAQSLRESQAALTTLQIEVKTAKKQRDALKTSVASMRAEHQIASRKQEAERRNAALSEVAAPTELTIAKVFHSTGEWVEQGQLLAHAYNANDLWIDAYFDESDLARLATGQHVQVTFDSLDATFSGTIDSISSVGGAILSPLSPNYSSGHVIRITQRYIARIPLSSLRSADEFTEPQPSLQQFIRPGMSARVDVDTP